MTDTIEMIAYCGLYCGECPNHTGKIADLARDLRKELRSVRFDKTAESLSELSFFNMFEDYDTCYAVLGGMVRLRCNKGCRSGGGNPFCKIRKCCQKKGFAGCWECDEIETCKKLDTLKETHKDTHRKNLRIIKKKGISEFIKDNSLRKV